MIASQKFRSALNGFNREDVVRYIEYTTARHQAEVTQLKEQLEYCRKEAASVLAAVQASENKRLAELEEKCAALEQENETLRQQVEETAAQQITSEEELAAYRRAERAERLAKSRVSQMCDQANAALADTTANLDAAAENLGFVAQEAMEKIQALQFAVSGSKQVLADAAQALGSIRPGEEE